MEYVTYDSTGALTGSYSQALQPEHVAAHIVVTAEQRAHWTAFRANAARDGLDAAPIVPAPPVVPAEISRRQALQALFLHTPSITQAMIETAIEEHLPEPQRTLALIELRESQVFERARPLLASIGPLMGLTPADMDALFVVGAGL